MNRIDFGDCRTTMRAWAAEGIKAQMCVTSPPYYGLRDYGHDGQIGLEETPEEFIANLVETFRCVRDVLADDGTLWINIGDSYASRPNGSVGNSGLQGGLSNLISYRTAQARRSSRIPSGMKHKDLMGIPWMLAFALRNDGAASPAHMRDVDEMIAAVTESYPTREQWPDRIAALVERLERERMDANSGGWYLRQDIIWNKPNPMPESVTDRCTKAHEYLFLLSKNPRYYFDQDAIKEPAIHGGVIGTGVGWGNTSRDDPRDEREGRKRVRRSAVRGEFSGKTGAEAFRAIRPMRNRRSVWTIATKPYKGAHFATFPPALVKPCILAGSRPGNIVLDPFMGSGTSAATALELGRLYLGCELTPAYKGLQDKRIGDMAASIYNPQLNLLEA